ncbi:MAG: EAL domain-containing protein [Pseudomonadota bacterium]
MEAAPDRTSEFGALERAVDDISNQICHIVDGHFDFTVSSSSDHDAAQKLAMLLNLLLEQARRSTDELKRTNARLELNLKERTDELDLVLEGSSDGVWIWDIVDDRMRLSERGLEVYADKELPRTCDSMFWYDRMHPKDRVSVTNDLVQHFKRRTPSLSTECRMRRADGQYRWVRISGAARFSESGQALVMAGTQTDIYRQRSFDAVLNLPNESWFIETLDDELILLQPLGMLVIEIDQIQQLRDGLEDIELSELRREVVNRISRSLPFKATVASLSNMQIGVSFDAESSLYDPRKVADLLLDAFDSSFEYRSRSLRLTLSIGAFKLIPDTVTDASQALRSARHALRQARVSGGSRVCVVGDARDDDAALALQIESSVRQALAQNRVIPFMQPIVDLRSGAVRGFEALARVVSVNGDVIGPGRFLPVAEQSDLICELGDRVLEHALAWLASRMEAGIVSEQVTVAINVSERQLLADGFVGRVHDLLAANGLAPGSLKLEVTETALVQDFELATSVLKALQAEGVKIALDDFGTGYSSLSYIRDLPVDVLKIDRGFVSDVHLSERKRAILETVISLGYGLGLEVIAEGIELVEEERVLQRLGVHMGQGNLYGRPSESGRLLRESPLSTFVKA